MKKLIAFFITLICVLLPACSYIGTQNTTPTSPSPRQITTQTTPQNPFDSLVTEPHDSIVPVLQMIQGAEKSIDLVMYELEDTQIENALIYAEKNGVAVRVLLNEGDYGAQPSSYSAAAYQYLQAGGVSVHWSPSYFALTHQKTMIVDGNQAVIMTFNLTPQYYSTDRDFGIVDKDPEDIAAVETAFNDDWQDKKDTAAPGDDLVWSPGADTELLAMINNTRSSLCIENEEMSDTPVVNALISAAKRGVKVEIVMTYFSNWSASFTKLAAAGVAIRTYAANASLYIHAKLILSDADIAFVGSQNFSASSLQDNRELGIMLTDANIINSLSATFQSDWLGGTPY